MKPTAVKLKVMSWAHRGHGDSSEQGQGECTEGDREGGRVSGSGGLEECELNHHLEVLLRECTTPR